jgi:hypothetical protein
MESLTEQQRQLYDWVSERLRYSDVPRLVDVADYAKFKKLNLNRKQVRQVLLVHPGYKMNMRQQRDPGRARMYRPVVVNNLGHFHGDIGYFATNRRYETPKSFRNGYLVIKDVLSRYIYVTILNKDKSSESIIRAFDRLLAQHYARLPNVTVQSISFDRETSVMSKKVQEYLAKKGITFHAFQMSSSKAKFAEGAIRQIRERMASLMARNLPKDRWWNQIDICANILNGENIVVNGKKLTFAPKDVTLENVDVFKRELYKAVPAYFYAQFDLAPNLVQFKYAIGTLVRAKLVATSSATVGEKRSEQSVTNETFVIKQQVPYVTRNMKVGKAYRCKEEGGRRIEIFQEDEITPTSNEELGEPLTATLLQEEPYL